MNEYWRPVLLPSGGISYSRVVGVRPLRRDFSMIISDKFFNSSDTELICSVLSAHVKGVNFLRLYFADAVFLWQLLLVTALDLQQDSYTQTCNFCEVVNNIDVNIGDIDIKYLNDRSSRTIKFAFTVDCDDESDDYQIVDTMVAGRPYVIIEFNRRKIVDNLLLGAEMFDIPKDDVDTATRNAIALLRPQFVSIQRSDSPANRSNSTKSFEEFLHAIPMNSLMSLVERIRNEDMGIQNNLKYKCKDCGVSQNVIIVDPFSSSIYMGRDASIANKSLKDNIDNMMSTGMMGITSVEEMMSFPSHHAEMFDKSMKNFFSRKMQMTHGAKSSMRELESSDELLG